MSLQKLIYEGKAKKIFETANSHQLIMEYKDSLTAFNSLKKGEFEGKGQLNCEISTLIFHRLIEKGIQTHWIETQWPNKMLVQKTKIIPLEVVVRNFIAGSFAKKLGCAEGKELLCPIVEFYYKDDHLGDPFVNDEQIIALGWASQMTLNLLKIEALKINLILQELFTLCQIKLIDFKVEFGFNQNNEIILADEISPDCMRIWDSVTQEKLDKDRFRHDLGHVEGAYHEVLNRLKKQIQLS